MCKTGNLHLPRTSVAQTKVLLCSYTGWSPWRHAMIHEWTWETFFTLSASRSSNKLRKESQCVSWFVSEEVQSCFDKSRGTTPKCLKHNQPVPSFLAWQPLFLCVSRSLEVGYAVRQRAHMKMAPYFTPAKSHRLQSRWSHMKATQPTSRHDLLLLSCEIQS